MVSSVVAPSLKVTMPVGVPAPGGITLTVAVNVTDCPNVDELVLDVTAVEVPTVNFVTKASLVPPW